MQVFRSTGVSEILAERGYGTGSAAELLRGYVRIFEMPGGLTEVGVGREKWELLARETMTDPWLHTNPRKVNGPEDLMEIFELAE